MKKKTMRSQVLIFVIALALVIIPSRSNAGEEVNATSPLYPSTAKEVVENLHKLLIKSMKMGKEGNGCKERYLMLKPFLSKAFDYQTISRIVLGRVHWNDMKPDEKKAFVKAFQDMTITTYASRFDSFSGQRFETRQERETKRGHKIVDAVLVKKDGEEIDFRYVLVNRNGQWKIVSVSAMGVNDLSVKRSDYNQFLKKHTIKELIEKLKEKAAPCLK